MLILACRIAQGNQTEVRWSLVRQKKRCEPEQIQHTVKQEINENHCHVKREKDLRHENVPTKEANLVLTGR